MLPRLYYMLLKSLIYLNLTINDKKHSKLCNLPQNISPVEEPVVV